MTTIDARDLDCPEPVIRTKKALENLEGDRLTVLLNSRTSLENVQRFVRAQGCEAKVNEDGGIYTLEVTRKKPAAGERQAGQAVMLIGSDRLGSGDEDLGQLLMAAFINTLPEAKTLPSKMLFINRGVFLTIEGSRVLASLQRLENQGVEIFSCGTCLNHYQLKDRLKAGKVTNMYETVDSLLSAGRVIRI